MRTIQSLLVKCNLTQQSILMNQYILYIQELIDNPDKYKVLLDEFYNVKGNDFAKAYYK